MGTLNLGKMDPSNRTTVYSTPQCQKCTVPPLPEKFTKVKYARETVRAVSGAEDIVSTDYITKESEVREANSQTTNHTMEYTADPDMKMCSFDSDHTTVTVECDTCKYGSDPSATDLHAPTDTMEGGS